jgi:subtilisin-like proprotein convertase family protein
LVLTEEDSITWSATAEFPVLVFILTSPCPVTVIASATAPACETASVTACLQPGTYYLWFGPSVFDGVSCDADYVATLTCQPCAQPFVCRCEELPNTHCNFTGVPIVDNTTVEMSIVVPIEYHITDLNVCLDIVHTWDSDLTISVVSPLGTVVELSSNNGGSGDNYTCTTFDDEASTLITAGTPPFTGSFIPEGSLASFDGENAIGTWIIRVYDGAGGDVGVLNWACLTFEYDYILAVELLGDLTATARDRAVTLNWSTASEVNNERFDILRAGRVVGTKAGAGTSSDRHDYSWTEERLDNGVTYTYTLVAVDVNGTRSELATISATPSFNAATVTDYALHQNFPNPFNPVTSIAFDLIENGFVSLKVYNLMGQEVASLVGTEMNAGRHIVNFDASRLGSGVYLYTIEAGNFSASKKMLLMK